MIEKGEGIQIQLFYGENEAEHLHQEIEIIYILDGQADASVNGVSSYLRQNDILIINTNYRNSIYANEDTILFKLYISYRLLAEYLEDDYFFFWCDTSTGAEDVTELRKLLEEMVLEYMETGKQRRLWRIYSPNASIGV